MILALGFLLVALIYSSVGFGGGSTYIALLAVSDQPVVHIPIVALSCNIIVVAIGSFMALVRRGVDWRIAAPFFLASVPMAFIGGTLRLTDQVFFLLLAVSLLVSAVLMLVDTQTENIEASRHSQWPLALGIGGFLGLLSGMVGIGGGIFLAPILHYLRWSSAKTIAAICSLFILVNSSAGLLGQILKVGAETWVNAMSLNALLLLAVLIGGVVGARVVIEGINQRQVKRVTAVLIFLVGLRLAGQAMS